MYIESQNCANIWNVPKKANTVLIKIQISNCAYTLIPHTTCICKSSEHLALDCPHSWYRRPQKIDPENDLVVENILAEVTQKAILVMLRKTVLVMTPLLLGIPPDALLQDPASGACVAANADFSSPTLPSAEVGVLDSQGVVLPKTPLADEVLQDLFLFNDEGQDEGLDGDFSTAEDGNSESSVRILRRSLLSLRMRTWLQLSGKHKM